MDPTSTSFDRMAMLRMLLFLFLGWLAGHLKTTRASTLTTTRACYDLLGNECFRYKDTDCVGPYETWARYNCSLRCGYCPQKLPCEDDLSYCQEFGKEVCQQEQYGQYMRQHCRKFCNFCKAPTEYLVSSTIPTTTPEPTTPTTPYNPVSEWCQDKLECWNYSDEKCVGKYESWARENCPFRCGYCPNFLPPCIDLDRNCAAFKAGSCTDLSYRAYMREHCRSFCNECHYPGQNFLPNQPPESAFIGVSPRTPISQSTFSFTRPTIVQTSVHSTESTTDNSQPTDDACYDLLGNECFRYKDTDCVGPYETWARYNCSLRCGYCPQKLPCEDDLSHCHEFGKEVCQMEQYKQYMRQHCRKFCNFCKVRRQWTTDEVPTEYLLLSNIQSTTPEPTMPTTQYNPVSEWCQDKLECWFYPDDKCVGGYESWARQNCPFRCGYCPNFLPPCIDLDRNCAAFIAGSCTDLSYRAYMREHCRSFCNECHYPGENLTSNLPPTPDFVSTTLPTTVPTKHLVYITFPNAMPVPTKHLVYVTIPTFPRGQKTPIRRYKKTQRSLHWKSVNLLFTLCLKRYLIN